MILTDILKHKKFAFFRNQVLIVLLFAILYYVNEKLFEKQSLKKDTNNSDEITFYDCIHFSLVTQTTIGYGNYGSIKPNSQYINLLQMFSVLGLTFSFFK